MTYPVVFDFNERAETEYALKRLMAEELEYGTYKGDSDSSYVTKARALKKLLETDNKEYWKKVAELKDIHY